MMTLPSNVASQPIVWTIAGSDNSGGAGIQADLKTFLSLGVQGCSVITSLTAQNSVSVSIAEPVSHDMLKAQLETLKDDMLPSAIKIGLLGDAQGVEIVTSYLCLLNTYVVYDPVMISSTGQDLLNKNIIPLLKDKLFPHIHLLTPNQTETEILVGRKFSTDHDIEAAALDILSWGVKSVVIKGWNTNQGYVQDYYNDGRQQFWLTSPARQKEDARGTGCTFSSAHAAAHALGYSLADAAVIAKSFVNQSIRQSQNFGKGYPHLKYQSKPCDPEDFPWLTSTALAGRNRPSFPNCGERKLGFYPIVDSLTWLKKLLPLGISTIQLRIKEKSEDILKEEIRQSIDMARAYNCRLFINDYWELAIKYGAYGVHLGQEDLTTANHELLIQSNIRLGLSTHCYEEVARALAYRPSYIAIGPIYLTTLKSMKFQPHGVDAFRKWRRMLDVPLVAIGGITLEKAPLLLDSGADGIAVVSDITQNKQPETRTHEWLALINEYQNVNKHESDKKLHAHSGTI